MSFYSTLSKAPLFVLIDRGEPEWLSDGVDPFRITIYQGSGPVGLLTNHIGWGACQELLMRAILDEH